MKWTTELPRKTGWYWLRHIIGSIPDDKPIHAIIMRHAIKKWNKWIERLLLSLKHPEMPTERPKFVLHVDGKEGWSWADIQPNWMFEGKAIEGNPWNEVARERLSQ